MRVTSLLVFTALMLPHIGHAEDSTVGKDTVNCNTATLVRDICSLHGSIEDSDKYKKVEDAITEDSGIVNKASRYQNSQQKIILKSQLANSLAEYKRLTKKTFSKREQCGQPQTVEINHTIRDMWSATVYSVEKLKVKQTKEDREYYAACNIKYEAISRKDGPDGKAEEPFLHTGD